CLHGNVRRGYANQRCGPCPLEVEGDAAHVLLRPALWLQRVEQERRVLRVRELQSEQQLQIERQVERLRHPYIHPITAVIRRRGRGRLRLVDLAERNRDRRAGRRERRLQIARHVHLAHARRELRRRHSRAARDVERELRADV